MRNPHYEDGKWFHVFDIDQMQDYFMAVLPDIRAAARECGYAIGLHGSMRRDLDLMAVPWVKNHATKDELALAINKAACGISQGTYDWEEKPCGRSATAFPVCWTEWYGMTSAGCIDLSVMIPQ